MGRVAIDQAAMRRLLNSPQGPMAKELLRAGNRVRNEALPLVPVDENRLRADVHVELSADDRGNLSAWVGSRLRYAAAVHNGRGAGKAWPPPGVLLGWMRRHGIPREAEFAIRRKIGMEGTTGVPFLSTALRRVFPNATTRS